MAKNDIKITLKTALDAAGIEATKSQMRTLQQSVSDSMRGMAADNKTHWADIKAVWDLGCGAIKKAWEGVSAGIKSAFHFETMTTQFKTLTGDIDVARAHMASLKELGDTPPFSLDEFAKASRVMMTLTDGALGYKSSLEMIGNAAAATGQPLESVAQATGRLYAAIRDGQPISRAAGELRNMGIITPGVVAELKDLQDAGADSGEIWDVVTKRLGQYDGAMQETEQTGEGLMGAISSRWSNLVRSFGDAFMDSAKGGLAALLDKLTDLEKSGAVQAFAEKVASACSAVIDALKGVKDFVGDVVGWMGHLFSELRSNLQTAGAVLGTFFGALGSGSSLEEARRMAYQTMREESADKWAEENLHKISDDTARNREIERGAQEDLAKLKEELAQQNAAEEAADAKRANRERQQRKEREKEEKKAEQQRKRDEEKAAKGREAAEKKERQRIAKAEIEGVQEDNRREQQRFKDRIKQLNDEIEAIEKDRKVTGRGMATDARVNDFGKAYRYSLDENGVIDNFTDWERARRYAGRAARDQATRDKRREHDDKKMKDLQDRLNNGEKLSKAQEKRVKDWEKFQDERDGVAKRQKQIEQLREDAEKAAIEGEKHLKIIRQKMADFVEGPVLK